jgi:hypothetical protein
MPGIEGSYSMVSMEMRRQDCVLRFLPGRVLLKGVAQRLRHGRQCYVTRSSRDIYCRNHVSIYGCKDSWVRRGEERRAMKCGIARVDNSGLSIVSSFSVVAARLRARATATATELRTQLANNGRLRCRISCFPQSRNKERLLDTVGKNCRRPGGGED